MANRRSGAWLARYALERLPISYTFGIPGVHNTELYDELNQSDKIRPVLVTHEAGGAFAADAISRSSTKGEIGCLVIVPAAGLTHAMSGIGECYLDGIPLLVITGGVRTDIEFGHQLHQIDQLRLADGIVKRAWRIESHDQIVPVIFEAYRTAISGVPGPVLVEIPVNIQLFEGPVGKLPEAIEAAPPSSTPKNIAEAVTLLEAAKSPCIFVGWGAVDVAADTVRIAEHLGAPVATTLQGMSAFPGNHPLHTGMGFSRAAVPAAENAFKDCDCLLAIGTRFGEIPTGSFGVKVPASLIHIDIDPEVIGRNYPAKVSLCGDARAIVPALAASLKQPPNAVRREAVEARIGRDKADYRAEWHAHHSPPDRVNPSLFFDELRRQLDDEAITVVDDGNHTFLTAELFEVRHPRTFLSPTDFNCMGYAVPAAIGAKLANPDRQIAAIVGDGAFLMTGLEILTATTLGLGIAYFVFDDGELSQISQGQEIPYNRKPCTVLGAVKLSGIAEATGAKFVAINDNVAIVGGIQEALTIADQDQPVIVDVRIDYSKRTRFTQGVVPTVLKRFPLRDRLRFIGRAMLRKVTG